MKTDKVKSSFVSSIVSELSNLGEGLGLPTFVRFFKVVFIQIDKEKLKSYVWLSNIGI